jgi:hypothetical protein
MYWPGALQLLVILGNSAVQTSATPHKASKCRNIVGDDAWPSLDEWKALNNSVSGRLIRTIPAGHVCHDPTYDAEACKTLNSTWIYSDVLSS